MSLEKNVPEIRFKGFNEPWNTEKIQNLIDRQAITSHLDGNHGELYPRTNEFSNSGIPYISANDFVTGFISFTGCKYLPTQRAQHFKKGIAKDGDILFAHNATVGPVAKLTTSYEFVILSTTATYFRCDNKTLINDYLLQALSNKKFVEQYSRVMAQSTRNQVPITVQRKFSISIPENTSEQTAIGTYFQKLDNLINQHQQKHDKLSKIKKAMLEKMFPKQGETTPEIRFNGFSGEWKEKELKEICTYHSSTLTVNDAEAEGKFELYDAQKCIGYTDRNIQDSDYITIIKDGSGVGRVRVLPKNSSFIATMGAIKPYESDLHFLYSCLSKIDFNKHISGATIPHVYFRDYGREKFRIPTFEEQTAIGNYFQKLDALINQHQQQITKLTNIKQACLSKMFV